MMGEIRDQSGINYIQPLPTLSVNTEPYCCPTKTKIVLEYQFNSLLKDSYVEITVCLLSITLV